MGPEGKKRWRNARTLHLRVYNLEKMKERNNLEDLDVAIAIISKYLL